LSAESAPATEANLEPPYGAARRALLAAVQATDHGSNSLGNKIRCPVRLPAHTQQYQSKSVIASELQKTVPKDPGVNLIPLLVRRLTSAVRQQMTAARVDPW